MLQPIFMTAATALDWIGLLRGILSSKGAAYSQRDIQEARCA